MRPPQFWALLLALCTSEESREAVLGDFYEEFEERVVSRGRQDAIAWYRRQALRSLPDLFACAFDTRPPFGLWRDCVAMVFATFVAAGCIILAGICLQPFESSLTLHGLWGYSYLFWCESVYLSIFAFIAGWVVLQFAKRLDVRVGLALAIAWVVPIGIPSLLGWSPPLPSGDWIVLPSVAAAVILGSAARIAWMTRESRSVS